MRGLNSRPTRYKHVALPTELMELEKNFNIIPHAGLEPAISGLEDLRVIQLR